MENEKKTIQVSEKYLGLRIAAFVAAIIIAIVSIAGGVSKLASRDEGWYSISPNGSTDAPLYAKDFDFQYYFTGSSSNIKEETKLVTALYSNELQRLFKLFDPKVEYVGFENLATINYSDGKEVVIEPDLYEALFDAYEKTLEDKGFNMFAGALYKEWTMLLNSSDYTEFDPVNSSFENDRIKALAAMVNDYSNFKLEKGSASYSVRFSVSKEYENFVKENEIEAPVIDLNILKNAYILDLLRNAFEKENKLNGYIQTKDEYILKLSDKDLGFSMYGYSEGEVSVDKTVLKGLSQAVSFNSFPNKANDNSSYIIYDKDNNLIFRNLFFDISTGLHNNLIEAVYVIGNSKALCVHELAYESIMLYNYESADDIKDHLSHIDKDITVYVYPDFK